MKYTKFMECTKFISCHVDNYSLHCANNTKISTANQLPRGLTKIIKSISTQSTTAIVQEKNIHYYTVWIDFHYILHTINIYASFFINQRTDQSRIQYNRVSLCLIPEL